MMGKLFQSWTVPEFRQMMALALTAAFIGAYFLNPRDEFMKGALVTAATNAWNYYLGSSKGAADANARADVQADTVNKLVEDKKK